MNLYYLIELIFLGISVLYLLILVVLTCYNNVFGLSGSYLGLFALSITVIIVTCCILAILMVLLFFSIILFDLLGLFIIYLKFIKEKLSDLHIDNDLLLMGAIQLLAFYIFFYG